MSDLSNMLTQRMVPDLLWFALVLAAVLAITHRLRMPKQGLDGQQSIGRFWRGLTHRHQRPTLHGHH